MSAQLPKRTSWGVDKGAPPPNPLVALATSIKRKRTDENERPTYGAVFSAKGVPKASAPAVVGATLLDVQSLPQPRLPSSVKYAVSTSASVRPGIIEVHSNTDASAAVERAARAATEGALRAHAQQQQQQRQQQQDAAGPRVKRPRVTTAPFDDGASDPPALRSVFVSFARQKDAFAHLDSLLSPLFAPTPTTTPTPPQAHPQQMPPLPALKIWAHETGTCGQRRFVVAHLHAWWARYAALHPSARHGYEILREDTPVHLYFDVEARTGVQEVEVSAGTVGGGDGGSSSAAVLRSLPLNVGLQGESLVSYLLWRVRSALVERYGEGTGHFDRSHVVHLESSTGSKFSRHVLVRLPSGARFRDTGHAGEFVMQLVEGLRREAASSSTSASSPAGSPLLQQLWVESTKAARQAPPSSSSAGSAGSASCSWASLGIGNREEAAELEAQLTLLEQEAELEAQLTALEHEQARVSEGGRGKGAPVDQSSSSSRCSSACHQQQEEGERGEAEGPEGRRAGVVLAREFLADLGVYTRNRAMRLCMSTKWGKGTPLLPASSHAYSSSSGGEGRGEQGQEQGQGQASTLQYWLDTGSSSSGGSAPAAAAASVLVGSPAWEAVMWRASLITDTLPPLWVHRVQAEGGVGGVGGEGGDGVTLGESHPAFFSRASYCPPTHPTLGTPLLYCWPLGSGEGEGTGDAPGARAGRQAALGLPVPAHATAHASTGRVSGPAQGVGAVQGAGQGRERAGAGVRVEGTAHPPPLPALAAWVCSIGSGPLPPSAWLHGATAPLQPPEGTTAGGEGAAAAASQHLYRAAPPSSVTIRSWSLLLSPATGAPSTAIYHLGGGSRWCHRIGRHHKGNHTWWQVDLGRGWAQQGCMDGECRAAGYRSPPVPVPETVLAQAAGPRPAGPDDRQSIDR